MLGRFFLSVTMDLRSNRVFIDQCQEYKSGELAVVCDRLLMPCVEERNLRSAQVLLKPNLISARLGSLACTEGELILAAAMWFLDHGARISIGDSPAFGTAGSVLRKIGIWQQLRSLDIPVRDFNKRVRSVTLPSGKPAGMAADALECDLLINMPRVKAHAQLRVTLAVKNLFGCVVGMRKPLWHMLHGGLNGPFTDFLAELVAVLPDCLTLVDGITAMHRSGPVGGDPFSLGIMVSSTNPVAADRSLLDILHIAPEKSPLMQACIRKGWNGSSLANLSFPFLRPEEARAENFTVPEVLSPIRFDPFRFIRGSVKRLLLKIRCAS